jgi:two-component system LytT family sensor kinase
MLWLVAVGVWTALTVLSITQSALALAYRKEPVEWGRLIAWRAVDWYSCALFLLPFVWMVRRAPLERGTWPRRLPAYAAATLMAAVAKYAFMVPIQRRLFGADRSLGGVLAGNAISELMIFWAVIGVLHAMEFYRRYREREALTLHLRAALSEAQLNTLRAQLHPHFLFNTLNAIAALLPRDPDGADTMLTRLGALLRLTLRTDVGHESTLREELMIVDEYSEIMRVRFAGQLSITRQVPAVLEDALVPAFILQPLLENALEHGIARLDGPGCVHIEARLDDKSLVLLLRDNGPSTDDSPIAGNGIGIGNTRARLGALYGEAASLNLRPLKPRGMEVEIRLPFHKGA